jgi:uncharacterized protein YggE
MEQLAEHRVEVEGTARRSLAAGRVLWSLVVTESGDRPAEAFARAGERLDALTRGLRDQLGDAADVRTGALAVRPQRDEHGRPLATVSVSGQVTVDVPLAEAGRAAGAAMSAGADQLNGPTPRLRDETSEAEALLGEAVEAARRKAEHAAAAAGRRLGPVVSMREEPTDGFPRAELMSAHASGYGGPELAPEDAEITASVRVTFALED